MRNEELEWCKKGDWPSGTVSSWSELDDSGDEAMSRV